MYVPIVRVMYDTSAILRLQARYCKAVSVAPSTLAKRIGRLSGKFFDRLNAGGSCTIATYNRILHWFTDNWPADLAWPSDIPRPEPSPGSPASKEAA